MRTRETLGLLPEVDVRNYEVNMQRRIIDVPVTTQTGAFATENTTKKRSGPSPRPVEERFWPKVHKTATCWLWTGARGNNYGHGSITVRRANGKHSPAFAHRVAWELAHGPIADGQSVLHSCDNPRCVNPSHLFLGTQSANLKDAASKGRLHVPRPLHARRKLSEVQVAAIRGLRSSGVTLAEIAARFGVTASCVSQIALGKRRVYTAPQLQGVA